MKAKDLLLTDLLEFEPKGGVIRFGGSRALIFDAVALGLLRKELIETLGIRAARGISTRFGFAHGWRTAELLEEAVPWDSVDEWKSAGGRLHRLQGLVDFEPVPGTPECEARARWHSSYEAEQHVLHCGQSSEPVCWSLAGFASGYLSRVTGEEIYAIEESCCGRGDAVCEMVAKTRAAWGGQLDSALMFYERDCLEASMVELRTSLAELEEQIAARRRALSTNEDTMGEVEGLVVRSPAMRRVLELASRAAHVDSTLLIHGESGVGKERIARFVHDRSARSSGPFVAINCGALPENLLESELSGHAKGAFSGASSDRAGLFEAAHTGTLLLDELGEIPPRLQVMLLRVLEERRVRRLGENHSRPIDVRVLGASHRDLRAMVKDGSFREDLFYRLRVIEVSIPPLRDRLDDILPLARVHLRATAERFGRAVGGLSPAAARALLAHNWPGNVRELANAVERAVVFAEGDQIEAHDLPDLELGENGDTLEGSGSLADVERRHILATLEASGGNRTEAARRLGIGSATLFRKLKAYREA